MRMWIKEMLEWTRLGPGALGWMSMKRVQAVLGRQEKELCKGYWSHAQYSVSLQALPTNFSLSLEQSWLNKSMDSGA